MAENGNGTGENLHNVAEQLYKQNLELAVKNKTLQLLRELYEISILALELKPLAEKVTKTVQKAMELELVSVMSYDATGDELVYLASAGSERFNTACQKVGEATCFIPIKNASNHVFFAPVLKDRVAKHTEVLVDAFDNPQLTGDLTQQFQNESHIQLSLFHPLVIEGRVLGVLSLNFNRGYADLNQSDWELIINLVNVIAVAFDRAALYQQIKEANEKLKELDKAKTEFVSMASHQLRAPLTAIKGYSSMLLEGSFGTYEGRVKEAINVIFQSSQKLVNVIEDFLNVTRIELGRMKYEMTVFDLRQLTELVTKELRLTIECKGLKLSLQWDNNQSYNVYGDYGKISQVINNLVDNAAKYSKSGEILVSLDKLDGKVRFSVKDQGAGMSQETLSKLFNKFVRADGAGQVNVGGTGLGLYVAKQIIEGHDGKIWAESEGEGKGSIFSFELVAK